MEVEEEVVERDLLLLQVELSRQLLEHEDDVLHERLALDLRHALAVRAGQVVSKAVGLARLFRLAFFDGDFKTSLRSFLLLPVLETLFEEEAVC